jgi:hypothetical protein
MLTPLLWVVLFQRDPVRPLDADILVNAAQVRAYQEQQYRTKVQKERGFEKKFNKLIDALGEFTRQYNGSQGQVWPAKQAEALRNALREVELALPGKESASKAGSAPATLSRPTGVPGNAVQWQ